jgi:heme/copper-type cytochrome/quinol oxidase subunit 2
MLGSTVVGFGIGFGIFLAAFVVLATFVVRFARDENRKNRRGPNRPGG